jgi:hypothetical protein
MCGKIKLSSILSLKTHIDMNQPSCWKVIIVSLSVSASNVRYRGLSHDLSCLFCNSLYLCKPTQLTVVLIGKLKDFQ